MKSKNLWTVLVTLGLTAGGVSAADEQTAAKELFESKCSVCHATSRPLGKNKDRAGWEQTVKRMQGKRAGHLSDAEVQTIVDYLTQIRGK